MSQTFDHLLILGRPAAGKSEFIDFMKKISDSERSKKFHIAPFDEVDDFVWIWEKFVEDDLWEKVGEPRLYSKEYMQGNPGMAPGGEKLFEFCMRKFNEEVLKTYISRPEYYENHTLFLEFARGNRPTFRDALTDLHPEIIKRAAIFFIDVTRDESWRRNVARYEEKLKHSVLAHMVPKETFNHYYSGHNWFELTGHTPDGYLNLHGVKVPFVTMNNEPESTDPQVLENRYGTALRKLFELYSRRQLL